MTRGSRPERLRALRRSRVAGIYWWTCRMSTGFSWPLATDRYQPSGIALVRRRLAASARSQSLAAPRGREA